MSELKAFPEAAIVFQAAVLIDDPWKRARLLDAWARKDLEVLSLFQEELDRAAAS